VKLLLVDDDDLVNQSMYIVRDELTFMKYMLISMLLQLHDIERIEREIMCWCEFWELKHLNYFLAKEA
jgi:hypothetical protein